MLNYHEPQQLQQPQSMSQLSGSIANADNFYYPQTVNVPALTLHNANNGGGPAVTAASALLASSSSMASTSASSLDHLHSLTQHNAFAAHNCNNSSNNTSNNNSTNNCNANTINMSSAAGDGTAYRQQQHHQQQQHSHHHTQQPLTDRIAVSGNGNTVGCRNSCSPDELTKIEDNYPLHVVGSKHSENVKRFSVNNLLELANDCRISGKLHHQHQQQQQQQQENLDATQINDLGGFIFIHYIHTYACIYVCMYVCVPKLTKNVYK